MTNSSRGAPRLRPPVVDIHAHAVPLDLLTALQSPSDRTAMGPAVELVVSRLPLALDGECRIRFGSRLTSPLPGALTDVAGRLAEMDRMGVDVQVVSPWMELSPDELEPDEAAVFLRLLNDGMAELAASQPDRLRALVLLDRRDPAAATAELLRTAAHTGVVGAELAAGGDGPPLHDPAWDRLWSAASEHGSFILLHPWRAQSPANLPGPTESAKLPAPPRLPKPAEVAEPTRLARSAQPTGVAGTAGMPGTTEAAGVTETAEILGSTEAAGVTGTAGVLGSTEAAGVVGSTGIPGTVGRAEPAGPGGFDALRLGDIVDNPAQSTAVVGAMVLTGVFDRFPELRLCVVHGGGFLPYQAGRFDAIARLGPEHHHPARLGPDRSTSTHVEPDRSTPARLGSDLHALARVPSSVLRRLYYDSLTHSAESLAWLVAFAGSDRVLLGSDFPFPTGDSEAVSAVMSAPSLTSADRAAILGGNASRLFR